MYFDDVSPTLCSTIALAQSSRAGIETMIGAAPVWGRNLVIGALLTKCCSKVTGVEASTTGLIGALLVGTPESRGRADSAGWLAIAGDESGTDCSRQSTWGEVVTARSLSTRQAISSAIAKLFLWHMSQPLAYLWVLTVYKCELKPGTQQSLASLVAAREILYMLLTVCATICCPVYLLMDPVTAWKEADSGVKRCLRIAAYVLTPHNYVSLCLGNCFRAWRVIFLLLAGIQVAADFGGCFALVLLLSYSKN